MISLELARQLKEAGLQWQPALHDFFAIPQPELDERVFVISDMTIDVEKLFGRQTITFNGAVEWSLDFIMQAAVLWMPTESQLRELLQERLLMERQPAVQLDSSTDGYTCQIIYQGQACYFEAVQASNAYAKALLHLLQNEDDFSEPFPSTGIQA